MNHGGYSFGRRPAETGITQGVKLAHCDTNQSRSKNERAALNHADRALLDPPDRLTLCTPPGEHAVFSLGLCVGVCIGLLGALLLHVATQVPG